MIWIRSLKWEYKYNKNGDHSLGWNKITSVGATELFDALKSNNSTIKQVYLSYNNKIDDTCLKSLGEYISKNKHIETISIGGALITDDGIQILLPYLEGNTSLKKFYLSENKGITDKSIPLLVKMIESSNLEDLTVMDSSITQKNPFEFSFIHNMIKCGKDQLQLIGM